MLDSSLVVKGFRELPDRWPAFLAVGVFDGVHLGHQVLLKQMVAEAKAANCVPAVLTFFPHPARVIRGLTGRYYLNDPDERVQYLLELGIEIVILRTFDDEFRQIRAEDFVQHVLQHFDLKELWGSDFSLGYKGQGDYAFLTTEGEKHGFSVQRIEAKAEMDDEVVSSSRIRNALREGDVAQAARCLTRPYKITGKVVYGAQRGRTINFPTANVEVWDEQLVPENGVYACRISVDGKTYAAATNVGVRPTVSGDGRLSVEAHILDFAGDIYGKQVSLAFVERIRPEQKFDGLDELKAQIGRDVDATRAILSPNQG